MQLVGLKMLILPIHFSLLQEITITKYHCGPYQGVYELNAGHLIFPFALWVKSKSLLVLIVISLLSCNLYTSCDCNINEIVTGLFI